MTDPRILITGASGFIGRALCTYILAYHPDVKIKAVVRSEKSAGTLPEGVSPIICNDFSRQGLKAALDGVTFDTIFHLAAYGVVPAHRDLDTLLDINSALPARLIEIASERSAQLVCAGTSAEYAGLGNSVSENGLRENDPLRTDKLYGATKAAGWINAAASAQTLGVTLTSLRLFNVYGAGEAAHRLLPSLVRQLRAGQRVSMSDGEQVRDFIYSEDVCRAFMLARDRGLSQSSASCETINICTGEGQSVKSFALYACAAIGAAPALLGFGDLPRRPDDIPVLIGNPEKAKSLLNFKARYTLEAGLQHTLTQRSEAA